MRQLGPPPRRGRDRQGTRSGLWLTTVGGPRRLRPPFVSLHFPGTGSWLWLVTFESICQPGYDGGGQYPADAGEKPGAYEGGTLRDPCLLLAEIDYRQQDIQCVDDRLEGGHYRRGPVHVSGVGAGENEAAQHE